MNASFNTVPPFSGSYDSADCTFLLQVIDISPISVEEKERRLQIGIEHYSSMVSLEGKPSEEYLNLFKSIVAQNKYRLAQEICILAKSIVERRGLNPTIVSLVRAGTPIGVLLNKAIKKLYGSNPKHFSISIVRDKGIDFTALRKLKELGIAGKSIIFVDGWTGKGVINKELKRSIERWNLESDYEISNELSVVSDIAGHADFSATYDDYVIPSGILNSTVSGLISRTLIHPEYTGLHQCVTYDHLKEYDLSNWFIDEVSNEFAKNLGSINSDNKSIQIGATTINIYLEALCKKYDINDINLIKPGLAEATRVLLRRVPELLIVKNTSCKEVEHLLYLANSKNIKVILDKTMPYNAVAIIKKLRN